MVCFKFNYDEMLDWFDDNIYKCLTLTYWAFIILGSCFYLIIDSNESLKSICPVSGIWSDLLFQTIVSSYGFFCLVFLDRGDCHDVLTTTKAKIIYYLDCFNIVLCVFAFLYNVISMSNTCNDKITHTSIYSMASANLTTILGFLIVSSLMLLHKNMIIRQAADGTERHPINVVQYQPNSPAPKTKFGIAQNYNHKYGGVTFVGQGIV